MVDKISLGSLSVSTRLISRIRDFFSGDVDAVAKKSLGEPPPRLADISQNLLIQSMLGGYGIVDRLRKKLKTISGRDAKIVPAHATIAMASQEEGLVYVGIEFLEEYQGQDEVIAGVLAHEWGHLIEELPPGFDAELLNYDQLWELRREKEAEADAFAGRALHQIGYSPQGFIKLLKASKGKIHTQKYFSVATRVAIVERAYRMEQERLKSLDQLQSGKK